MSLGTKLSIKKCSGCGQNFEDHGLRQNAKWCSDICRNRHNRSLKKMNKEGIMKTKAFPEIITEVLSQLDNKKAKPFKPIHQLKIKHVVGDEEVAVLKLSDWQLGHKTISFNYEVAEKRVHFLAEKVLKIISLHRKAYPIKKLHIWLEGDFIQNDKFYFVDQAELESVLIDQIYEHAVPLLGWFISEMAKNFNQVIVSCVRGNHGRGERGSSEKNNWDDVIYRTLQYKFENCPNVTIDVAREFYKLVKIFKWNYLIVHGDQVKGGSYGIPLYALLQRMLRWATSMPFHWDVLSVAHWHCFGHIEQNHQELFVNGTLVSDDEFVRKNYGWDSSTSQILFGVHKHRKVTWTYKVNLLDIGEKI
jgi:hypothetical protein